MTESVAILGVGAIGTVMAFWWQQRQPLACLRPTDDHTALQRKLSFSEVVAAQLPEDLLATSEFTTASTSELQLSLPGWQNETLEWLLLSTKASATLPALQNIKTRLAKVKNILLLQNGMGQQQQVAEWLAEASPTTRLWLGSSTDGAYLKENHDTPHYFYAGLGEVVVGPAETSLPASAIKLPPHCQPVDNIHQRLFNKLAINAVINPLTALYRCPNGELISNPDYRERFLQLTAEVSRLGNQLQWRLVSDFEQLVESVAVRTAANRSSTLQDLDAGRATELPWILGYVLEQAQRHNIRVPIATELAQQLEAKGIQVCP